VFDRAQKMYPFFDKGGNDGNGDFQIAIRDTQPQINKQVSHQGYPATDYKQVIYQGHPATD